MDTPEAVEETCDQRRLRSDCVDAQADLSLLVARLIVSFVVHWLIYELCKQAIRMNPCSLIRNLTFVSSSNSLLHDSVLMFL